MTSTDRDPGSVSTPLKRAAGLIGGGLMTIFALGVAVGLLKAVVIKGTLGWKAMIVLLIVGLLVVVGLALVRWSLMGAALAKSPRMREYQIVTIATCLLGVVIGFLMQLGEGPGKAGFTALTANASLSPAVAAVLLATLPLLGWLTYRWHMTADEHEQSAYNFGAVLSLYAYFFGSIGWWVAWRGGLVPEPSGFAIFWLVMIVWSLGWLWKRYR